MTTQQINTTLAFNAVPAHRLYRLRLARYQAMAEAVATHLELVDANAKGKRGPLNLLDVGPGSGRSMAFLEEHGIADRFRFHGIDHSENRLDTIYKPERWQLECGDVTKGLPYESERFDVSVCEQVLEHIDTPEDAIAEMVRVLRPGGLMILGVPTFPPGIAHARTAVVKVLERAFGWKRGHVQTFTSGRMKKLVSKHPLRLIACRGFRIISGGPLSRLEDHYWWYRLNRSVGQAAPWACTEVQLVLQKLKSRGSRDQATVLRVAG
jgi:ubiquinone/menaquinone biosynthesis C-methylase UbiE